MQLAKQLDYVPYMLTVECNSCWLQRVARVGGAFWLVLCLGPCRFNAKVCTVCLQIVNSYDGTGMEVLPYHLPACRQI